MSPPKVPHVEVVLPVYNEVQNIVPLLRGLDAARDSLAGRARISYLFVNDGSRDGSRELLYRLHRERADIRVVEFVHNFGHSAALAAGVDHVRADAAVFMDADLQDSPDALPALFEAWKQGARTVVIARAERREAARIAFQAFYFILHRLARQLPPFDFGTHCILDISVVERLRDLTERNRYFPGLVSYASGPITAIPMPRGTRHEGKSRVGMMGLMTLAITAYVSFSSVPIRMVSFFGIAASAMGFLSGTVIVLIKIASDKAIPGWASVMSAMAFGTGVQLLCLGILGEYVARIYDEVKQRPLYLVERVHERKAESKAA